MSRSLSQTLKGILFDFDGTIADTRLSIVESLEFTVKTCLGRELEPEEAERYLGLPLSDTMRMLSACSWQQLVDVYLAHNLSNFHIHARLFPGTMETLQHIEQAGILMGLVTSKRRHSIEAAMDLFGIGHFFQVMVCAEDVQRPKPDPEGIILAMEALGLEPRHTAMVGDSPYDVRAGLAAGVTTIAAMWGMFRPELVLAAGPDMVCYDISELRKLIPLKATAP